MQADTASVRLSKPFSLSARLKQEERQKLLEEEKERGKVVKGLSIMSGLLLVLILW